MENGSQKLKDSDIVQTNDEKEVEAAGRGVPQSGNDDVRADKKRILLGEGRTGGAYIPPFKLARMLAEVEDRESVEYQRLTWDALRKSINGLVNKVNASNIKYILPEMFSENILRGMGLLCRSLMRSQVASPPFTPVYAALIAVINTKFPEIGELLLHRVLTAFKRSFRRNDKTICLATLKFIAHLVNQQVVHEVLAFELALLLQQYCVVKPAGLCCAALLAKYGYSVIVCEAHYHAGGAAHAFKVQDYCFDSGPSFFAGISGPGRTANPLKQVLDIVGESVDCVTYAYVI